MTASPALYALLCIFGLLGVGLLLAAEHGFKRQIKESREAQERIDRGLI